MNFLAHFYTGHTHQSPYFHTGLVLPDLTRNYNRELKLKEEHTNVMQKNDNLILLNDGIRHHLLVDGHFHNSKFFQNSMTISNDVFKANNFNTSDRYLYFISHVLVELLIDRFLIKTDPALCDRFYDSLHAVKQADLAEYLHSLGFSGHEEGFFKFFDMFKEVQYVRHYVENERLLFALNRIYTRATGKELENEKHLIYECISEVEEKISKDIQRLLHDLTVSPQINLG